MPQTPQPPQDRDPTAVRLVPEIWMEAMTDAAVLDLPLMHARPESLAGPLDAEPIVVSGRTMAQLRVLAGRTGRSTFEILLCTWQVLLYRYTNQADLVIGCSTERPGSSSRDVVLLLRLHPLAGDRFSALLDRAAAECAPERWENAPPFTAMLQALQIESSGSRHPIFQSAVTSWVQDLPPVPAGPSDHCVPCDLTLAFCERAAQVEARIEFPRSLFETAEIRRMAGHFLTLLTAAVADPECTIGRLPLLSAEDEGMLRVFNRTSVSHDAQQSLGGMFLERVLQSPEAIALESGSETLSFKEVNSRACRLARALQERGVGAGQMVAISMNRGSGMIVSVLAVLKAGAGYVPIDPAYPVARRDYMLADSGAAVLLTDAATMSSLSGFKGVVICLERDGPQIQALPESEPENKATGASTGYIIYTSGSTGEPKGVVLPQRALTNLVSWQLRRPDFVQGRRTLQFSSLSFDVSFQEIATSWCSGGTLVLVTDAVRRDARALLDHIIKHRVERIFLPFVALRGLAEAAVTEGRSPELLQEVYTAGEQLQVDETIRRFFAQIPGCLLENQYGPSEAHVVTAGRLDGPPASWPPLPGIGSPIANTVIRVLDPQGEPCPIGVPGELHIGGICLADGYAGKPELSAARFISWTSADGSVERLYRTGDLARWLPDGTIQFHGRMDHQVKFRGYRIEPGEIAAQLGDHPDVARCVVQLRSGDGSGRRLVAYVGARAGRTLTRDKLLEFARARLPDYMVPTHFVVLDSFPLTPSGKVDMKALPEPQIDRSMARAPYVAPGTATELALARIWSRLLGLTEVGIHDDFYELGGDSLIAVEMFAAIRRELDCDLPLGALAHGPTIEALARQASAAGGRCGWKCLVPIRSQGTKTPLFCIHGGSGNVASFPKLARQLPEDQPFYALQWSGLDGTSGDRSIPAMARRYLREIRQVQPRGPYLFAGQCIGGLVAREMTRRLLAAGEQVELVVMFDTPNISSPVFHRGPITPYWRDILKLRSDRRAHYEFYLQHVLGMQVQPRFRLEHAERRMIEAARSYRVPEVEVRTLAFGTGYKEGSPLGLPGKWDDEAMGWSPWFGTRFSFVPIAGDHNQILTLPEVTRLVLEELEQAHERIATRGGLPPGRHKR